MAEQVKERVLPQLWHRLQLQLGVQAWTGNFLTKVAEKYLKKILMLEDTGKRFAHGCLSGARFVCRAEDYFPLPPFVAL